MYCEVKDVAVFYDRAIVLNELSLHVNIGEMVCLVGPNGAGKSTLLRAMTGLVKWERDTLKGTVLGKITLRGSVKFNEEELINLPAHEIAKKGLILCPERGRPFREMTVMENLEAAVYLIKDKRVVGESLEKVYKLFPVLKERSHQVSGSLSGGERSMLAISRALMAQPKLLLIDEPSIGLAPLVKENLFARIKDIHGMGVSILLTEQDVSFAFDLASRNYVLSRGKIIAEGTAQELLGNELIRKTYLGL